MSTADTEAAVTITGPNHPAAMNERRFYGGSIELFNDQQGKVLSLEESFEALIDFDVIFVGEIHDSRFAHEAELTSSLDSRNGIRIGACP